jgi:hypothetical protein
MYFLLEISTICVYSFADMTFLRFSLRRKTKQKLFKSWTFMHQKPLYNLQINVLADFFNLQGPDMFSTFISALWKETFVIKDKL